MTREDMIAFEADIAACFNRGEIRAPVHLAGGNEDDLLKIFQNVRAEDWVCTTWRSHYHCLLKGVPPERLKADILAGKSITLNYPEHRIVSSAIVGGTLPIALGLAWSIKRAGGTERVWVFLGDMATRGGMFSECSRYAIGHRLPISFVIEDNGRSVCTDTRAVWGNDARLDEPRYLRYEYTLPWPHSGAGKRIEF